MRRLFNFVLGVMLVLAGMATTTPQATAQTSLGPRDLGFAYANDYNKWVLRANGDIASGASVVTIQADGYAVTPGGRAFYPLATNAPVIVDQEASSVTETVTPSAVTCTQNSLSSTCTFSATFTYAHRGFFTIRSATFGIQEAINDILNVATGGTVVVANGNAATNTTLTSTVAGGNSTTNLLDTRAGAFQFYAWGGSAYSKSTSPLNTTTTPAATVTAVTGTPFLYCAQTQSTNHCIAEVALGANTSGATFDFVKTRSATASGPATTTIVTADALGTVNFFGADGTNYIQSAQISAVSTGTIGSTRVPSKILLKTGTDAAPTVLTTAVTIDSDQSVLVAGNFYVTGMTRISATAPDTTITAKAVSPSTFIPTVGTTNAQYASAAIGANATGVQDVYFKTRDTTQAAPATTVVVTADAIAQHRFFGADGTNYIEAARIEVDATGTIASTRVPGKIIFSTGTDAAPTVLTTALVIDKDQSTTPSGGLKTATANSGAAGFQTIVADTGSPAAGTTGTNTTGIANQLWYTQIYVPYNMTITNAAILCGGTCTTDKIAIGIYTTDGQTLLKATAATVGAGTVLSGANTWQKLALTSTVTLSGPAKYIVGVVTSGTTAGDFQAYPLANGPVCAVQTGMGTLATAFTPATTGTASSCPYVVLN